MTAVTRDAERSRRAILDAAEARFSAAGYAGTGLGDVAADAGLSRGTPSYFFGSKAGLHHAVLERVFADRQAATAAAFAPVGAWCAGRGGTRALRGALERATAGYLDFLLARPAFVRLLAHEDLEGGERLRAASRRSTAMHDAFATLRAVAPVRGVARFDVDDAVLLFVSVTYAPLAHERTLMAALGRDLHEEADRRRHVRWAAGLVHGAVNAP